MKWPCKSLICIDTPHCRKYETFAYRMSSCPYTNVLHLMHRGGHNENWWQTENYMHRTNMNGHGLFDRFTATKWPLRWLKRRSSSSPKVVWVFSACCSALSYNQRTTLMYMLPEVTRRLQRQCTFMNIRLNCSVRSCTWRNKKGL